MRRCTTRRRRIAARTFRRSGTSIAQYAACSTIPSSEEVLMRPTRHTASQRATLALLTALLVVPIALPLAMPAPAAAQQGQQPSAQQPSAEQAPAPDVEVQTTKKTTTWYASPTLIIVGVAAVVLVIVLVGVSRGRGGNTTVIKD